MQHNIRWSGNKCNLSELVQILDGHFLIAITESSFVATKCLCCRARTTSYRVPERRRLALAALVTNRMKKSIAILAQIFQWNGDSLSVSELAQYAREPSDGPFAMSEGGVTV